MNVYVALLRGVNVGGKSKVPMANLKNCFKTMGFRNISTYINSGNVIFTSELSDLKQITSKIEKTLELTFGFAINVVVKSLPEMQAIVSQIPKNWYTATDIRRNVIFLRPNIDKPDILKELHPKAKIEEVHYYPGVLLWSAKIASLGTTDMLKIISRPIYKEITVRNFNTTVKVLDIMMRTLT